MNFFKKDKVEDRKDAVMILNLLAVVAVEQKVDPKKAAELFTGSKQDEVRKWLDLFEAECLRTKLKEIGKNK